ncbi:MAG: hypothetical protein BWY39_00532 [Spirochaetes bacterium ADurb.Bin269]|nr:MAG: hypothetical protein BWY39_00532 [Spirochaetes bacterium ADurb.Bin269]
MIRSNLHTDYSFRCLKCGHSFTRFVLFPGRCPPAGRSSPYRNENPSNPIQDKSRRPSARAGRTRRQDAPAGRPG